MTRALISGITGQVGSYLAELLLEKGYEVHGLIRKSSTFATERIDHIFADLQLHYWDMGSFDSILSALARVQPDEVYNLAAQSHVKVSFDMPIATGLHTGLAPASMLEAVRIVCPGAKFYQASSSELFGGSPAPQREISPITPRSPYAAAKAYAYYMTKIYREAYGMFAVNGILFNTESPRRNPTFVTRKITHGIARIVHGYDTKLVLGNLDAQRDWGHAKDYVRGIHMMMQHETADDWVLASGKTNSVRTFVLTALYFALEPNQSFKGWMHEHVVEDPRYLRPLEVDCLQGDASKAHMLLGWKPEIGFEALVEEMMTNDLECVRQLGGYCR